MSVKLEAIRYYDDHEEMFFNWQRVPLDKVFMLYLSC